MRWLLPAALVALGACAGDAQREAPATEAIVHVGSTPLRVRVARTPEARRRGLMGVAALDPDEGMLFVYPEAAPRRFWMEGCLVALDIAFLDERGTVLQVDTLQPPATAGAPPARTRTSPPARYALEARAGFFARHGHGPGTRVDLPASLR